MFTRVRHWSSVTRNGWSEPSSQLIVITVVTSDRLPSQPNGLCHWRVCLHSAYPSWYRARPDWGDCGTGGIKLIVQWPAILLCSCRMPEFFIWFLSPHALTHTHKRSRCLPRNVTTPAWLSPDAELADQKPRTHNKRALRQMRSTDGELNI